MVVTEVLYEKEYVKAAELAGPGVEKYMRVRDMLASVNVAENIDFQKSFNGFYRMRQRPKAFYDVFFRFMEERKGQAPSFEETLRYIYRKCDRIEASFSSKLVATIDPEQPVWDQHVLANLDLKAPSYSSKNRVDKCVDVYDKVVLGINALKNSDRGEAMIAAFNHIYPKLNITDTKKIDFILWQMRG